MKRVFAHDSSKLLINKNEIDNPFSLCNNSNNNINKKCSTLKAIDPNVVITTTANDKLPVLWLMFNDRIKLVLIQESLSNQFSKVKNSETGETEKIELIGQTTKITLKVILGPS